MLLPRGPGNSGGACTLPETEVRQDLDYHRVHTTSWVILVVVLFGVKDVTLKATSMLGVARP